MLDYIVKPDTEEKEKEAFVVFVSGGNGIKHTHSDSVLRLLPRANHR